MLAEIFYLYLVCFTINKILISDSALVALQRYPYSGKSIFYISHFKFLKFLNIRIFVFNHNREVFTSAFYTLNKLS